MTVLETARLRLRPSTTDDRGDLFALEQDAEVMGFLNGGEPTPADGIDLGGCRESNQRIHWLVLAV